MAVVGIVKKKADKPERAHLWPLSVRLTRPQVDELCKRATNAGRSVGDYLRSRMDKWLAEDVTS